MSPAEFDNLLELWARSRVSDVTTLRALWYPSATAEHRFARRGGLPPALFAPTPEVDVGQQVDLVDRAIAALKQHHELWYRCLTSRYFEAGPDERRASQVRLDTRTYQMKVASAKRWVKRSMGL